MEQTDSCQRGGRGDWMKDGEQISQRTFMQDPWTRTMIWGLAEGVGCGAGWRWAKGKKAGITVIA